MPKGWRQAAVVDLLAPLSDGRLVHQGWSPRCETEPSRNAEDWGVLKTTAIQDGRFYDEHNKRLPESLSPRPLLEVHEGDLLMTCAGPRSRCGIPALVRTTRPRLMMSGKMYRMRPSPHVEPGYVEAALRTSTAQEAIDQLKTGMSESGMNLTHERFATLQVPVAPAAEQRRIVAKLDALTVRTERARADLYRIPALAARYKQAVLAKAFASSAAVSEVEASPLPEGWEIRTLGELVFDGPTNGWSPPTSPGASGTLSLKLTATTSGALRLDDAAVKRLDQVVPRDSKYWLEPGDLLVQRANALEHVGASAIFEGPRHTYVYPDLMMRLRIENPFLRRLIWRYLNSDPARQYFRENATGTAGNMPKINRQTVRGLPIPLPPSDQWEEVARGIDHAFSEIGRMSRDAAAARRLLDRLDQAVLAKAFRGELVPQDPADEPASILLDRIRAERASAPKVPRGRRKAVA